MDAETGASEPVRPDGEASQRSATQATGVANGLGWRQDFAGEERSLRQVRAWLASLLPPCPARDDVLSIATELGANAVRHTASGHGGSFTVEIAWTPPLVRVAVADGGGLTEPHVIDDLSGEHGRGLLLVRGLAGRTGVDGDQHGRRVWAEVTWNGPAPAASPISSGPPQMAADGSPPRPLSPSPAGLSCTAVSAGTDLMMEVAR